VTLNSAPAPAVPAVPAGRRLAWLDALRGIAALFVVFDHLSYYVLQHARHIIYQWFAPGQYGVFVFFLVSGYIVPASLERKGSVRGFWVSRVFRLYPLYLFGLVAAIVLWKLGIGGLGRTNGDPETSVLTHALMLSNVLGTHNAITVIWTLSYEMAFYLLLTALFVTGVHKPSAAYALGFAAAAVAVGGLLPMTALSNSFLGTRLVAGIADLLVVVGVALAVMRFRLPKIVGALVAAGTAMVLVCFNSSWVNPFEALTILALMFTGTMLYRAERGDFDKRRAAVVVVAVFVLAAVAGLWHTPPWDLAPAKHTQWDWQWFTSLLLAGLTFGVGMACRKKKMPSVLAWLGLVSYSVYLLHPLLVDVYHRIPITRHTHSLPAQLLLAAVFMAVLLGCSALSYRFVELPMQRQGKKLSVLLEGWFGPDTAPEEVRRPAVGPGAR
jgi:peptidoglycan/LPS O-acetylase OafA/YrhL